jgi:alkylation response protein AidB-like acyl-CoA dehydrogenase
LSLLDYCLIMEEIIRHDNRIGMALSLGSIPSKALLRFGNDEQKKKYLPKLTKGEAVGSIAVTEPNHGSDIRYLDTRAVRKGDEYIINGNKTFITNADIAEFYTVFAQTDPEAPPYRGISGFIVERETEGVTALDLGDKVGLKTTSSCSIEFRDVKVPKENLLGKEDHGFTYIMDALNEGRSEIATEAIGLARGAYDRALFHAKNREQFGQKIGKFQNISHLIVEMSEEIESAALLAYKAVWLIDQGKMDVATSLQAKVKCPLTAIDVCLKAMQILAGYGLFEDQFLPGYLGDALATWLLEGTGQIQRNTVAGHILGKL